MAVAAPRVAVVGAGVAGLRCAEVLLEAGVAVELIEARARVGGRVLNSLEGLPLGAAWVHGTVGNEVAARLAGLGVEAREVTPENPWMRPRAESIAAVLRQRSGAEADQIDGSLSKGCVRYAPADALGEAFDELAVLVRAAAAENQEDVVLSQGLVDFAVRSSAPDLAAACRFAAGQDSGLAEADCEDRVLLMALGLYFIETWMGATIDQLGLAEFKEFGQSSALFGDAPGPHCLLAPPGYVALVDAMESVVRARNAKVHMEEALEKVEVLPGGRVALRTRGSAGAVAERQFEACVLTLPLPLLRQVTFSPQLAEAKRHALNTLQMGRTRKVFLVYDSLPESLPSQPLLAVPRPDSPLTDLGPWLLVDNWQSTVGLPSLSVELIGDCTSDTSCKAYAAAVLAYLRGAFGEDFPEPRVVRVTAWVEDQWSQGTYSYFPKGADESTCAALSEPAHDGRLLFAGEACDEEFQGSVPAAYLSGARAAQEILRLVPSWTKSS